MKRCVRARLVKRYPRGHTEKKRWVWQVRYPRTEKGEQAESIGYWTTDPRDKWKPRSYGGSQLERLSERAANDRILSIQEKVLKGLQDKPSRKEWEEFSDQAIERVHGIKYTSKKELKRALEAFAEKTTVKTPRDVNTKMVWEFVEASLIEGIAESTVNKWLGGLRRIWFSEFPNVVNPFSSKTNRNPNGIKRFPVVNKKWHWWSVKEIRKLLSECDNWWKAVILCAYTAGMRQGEIMNLTWADIDFTKKTISVRSKHADSCHWAWSPKSRQSRNVPLTADTEMAFNRVDQEEGVPYVFVPPARHARLMEDPNNQKRTKEVIFNLLDKFHTRCRWAEVPQGDFHALRKTCIANWLTDNMPIHEVQRFAGHTSPETTIKFYSQIDADAIQRARNSAKTLRVWNSVG